ncbi:hypothetical protein [Chryseobacterium binzhouense]|uniref:hypothetical protein n=1 Tax=Chryseobacterium binzhouense TaxID=2593646 RepID=UPI0028A237F5|nr:hypothetical protein [Chryseobacterium binzhouense]
MKTIVIFLILTLVSCEKLSHNEIKIYPVINKKDSLLILTIKNDTDSNVMIEFPALDNFNYKDEFEESTPEVLYFQQSVEDLDDENDLMIYKNNHCKTVSKIMNSNSIIIPKFIKKNSKKKYYLKIDRYRKGETLVFSDAGFDELNIPYKKKPTLNNIKTYSCAGYKYFTGKFSFYPNKIVLE